MTPGRAAVWHDVECAGYSADLDLWDEFASAGPGPVAELGAGTGRVALALAERGHEVVAVDVDRNLLDELGSRAAERDLEVETVCADVRELELNRTVGICIAPMQLVQLLGGADGRARTLSCVRAHLSPGATFAAATVEPPPAASDVAQLPDVRDVDGWVYSSTPLSVDVPEHGGIVVERLRELVSPDGVLERDRVTITLDALDPDRLAAEASNHGLREVSRREIAPTDLHLGSVVVVLEAV